MPNRILNSNICTSDSIDALTFFQEAFFYRLLVSVDDYGAFDARPKIIRAAVFPLKNISLEEIEAALSALEKQGMLQYYTVKGKRYLHLTGWGRFQRLRNSKHKYPAPCSEELEIMEESEEGESIEGSDNLSDDNLQLKCVQKEKNENRDSLLRLATTGDSSRQLAATRGNLRQSAATCGNLQLARAQNPNPNPNPNTNTNTKKIMSGSSKHDIHWNEAKKVIDYLNQRVGTHFRYSQSSMRHIIARLNDNFTIEDCKSVIDKKSAEWLSDPKMQQFLRPETLFAGKFEGYLNQSSVPPSSRVQEQIYRRCPGDDLPF